MKEKKSLKRRKRITLKEIYLKYPYKWRNLQSNTVELPYFPASEITEHDYTLSYKEWREVVLVLFEEYIKYLMEGNSILVPHSLGRFTICKYKPVKQSIDFKHYKETGEKIFHDNSHTDGYCPMLYWNYRHNTHAKFKYKRHWSCTFVDPLWVNISKRIQEDFTLIYNWQEI